MIHIADRVLNRPLLLDPAKATIVLDVLAGRIGVAGPDLSALPAEASRFRGSSRGADGAVRPYNTEGGVAIIPIVGSLVNRGAWIGAHSGLVSYEGIGAQLRAAGADPEVKVIVLDIDSGGGEAGGIAGLAALVRAVGARKKVVAVVNDTACSAAYWIASQAGSVIVSETSLVGSIGVLLLHMNRAEEMKKKGVAPTFIHAGARKIDGHPFGPLSKDVLADLQAQIDALYGQFVTAVAQGRAGRMNAAQIRATEARVFTGREAVRVGLADRAASLDDVIADLQAGRIQSPGAGVTRSRQIAAPVTKPNASAQLSAAQIDAAWSRAIAKINQQKG